MFETLWEAMEAGGGLLRRRDHPALGSSVDRALRRGAIEPLVPGVYCAAGAATLALRAVAVGMVAPDSVITGRAAAALTWWPDLTVPVVEVAHPWARRPAHGVRWHQQSVPLDHVVDGHGIRVSNPVRTVLDLIPELSGRVIDEALRRGVVTLEALWQGLAESSRRPGNPTRRDLLVDSREEPWSEAERLVQRGFRRERFPFPHLTNHRVELPGGAFRLLDLALPDLMLGFEIDGYEHHGTHRAFIGDRWADRQLARLGWHRVRIEATAVFDDLEAVMAEVREIVHARAVLLGRRRRGRRRVRS